MLKTEIFQLTKAYLVLKQYRNGPYAEHNMRPVR